MAEEGIIIMVLKCPKNSRCRNLYVKHPRKALVSCQIQAVDNNIKATFSGREILLRCQNKLGDVHKETLQFSQCVKTQRYLIVDNPLHADTYFFQIFVKICNIIIFNCNIGFKCKIYSNKCKQSLTLNCIRGVPWYPTFCFSASPFQRNKISGRVFL